jgi:hypothetical protein
MKLPMWKAVALVGAFALALLACAALTPWWIANRFQAAFVGPVHTFEITNPPPFLTDDLAVKTARDALELDGFNVRDWRPREDRRTVAPDGTRDEYLSRNGINPNHGSVTFVDESGATHPPVRFVHVELIGSRLSCQVVRPK